MASSSSSRLFSKPAINQEKQIANFKNFMQEYDETKAIQWGSTLTSKGQLRSERLNKEQADRFLKIIQGTSSDPGIYPDHRIFAAESNDAPGQYRIFIPLYGFGEEFGCGEAVWPTPTHIQQIYSPSYHAGLHPRRIAQMRMNLPEKLVACGAITKEETPVCEVFLGTLSGPALMQIEKMVELFMRTPDTREAKNTAPLWQHVMACGAPHAEGIVRTIYKITCPREMDRKRNFEGLLQCDPIASVIVAEQCKSLAPGSFIRPPEFLSMCETVRAGKVMKEVLSPDTLPIEVSEVIASYLRP